MDWQPIKTAPKSELNEVLVCEGDRITVASWAYDDRWQPEGLPSFQPTHWMPLPDLPSK